MLKRLELLGFKSFADKTAFEFGSGITCIVGPNGSGKSNVVDAIKWVLGEQSAKSLRGSEMADVIFNGSATRRSFGLAEATLVFDNTKRLLPVDTDEVQLTRRVYRSSEGEYLINKNPARLRDFRDLFMGTGAGTEAYSVIEQGKVDVLLQASTRDRRLIFEEAAGISKFKARKMEALRKLEHVDQNLVRLNDIVEEVEKQLRSVKLQAAKARRFQEHSERMRELRLRLGLSDYHAGSAQLAGLDQKTERLTEELSGHVARCNATESKLVQVQSLTEELDDQIRTLESSLGDCRQEITRLESHIGHERAHTRDLAGQLDRLRTQWFEFSSRVAELQERVSTISTEVDRVQQQCTNSRVMVEADAASLDQLRGEVESRRDQSAEAQSRLMANIQAGNDLHNQITSAETQERALRAQRQRLVSRCQSLSETMAPLRAQLSVLAAEEGSTVHDRDALRDRLNDVDEQLEDLWLSRQQLSDIISELREQRSAVAARIEVLSDLERRREGVGLGVQEVLGHPDFAALAFGMVADLMPVDLSHATVVERALGERAQHVVVRDRAEIVARLGLLTERLQSPVSLVAVDVLNGSADRTRSLPGEVISHPAFVARASEWVSPAAAFERLADHLLGRTVIVQDLQAAIALSQAAPGYRFVTVNGDIVEADGTITIGAGGNAAGLVSRKSQLRAIEDEAVVLDERIARCEQDAQSFGAKQSGLKNDRALLEAQLAAMVDQASRLGQQLSQRRQQLAGLQEELQIQQNEIAVIDAGLNELLEQRATIQRRIVEVDEDRQELEQWLHELESDIERRSAEVEDRHNELTASKIELAKTEGHLGGLRQRFLALTADLEDRRRVQQETRDETAAAVERKRGCRRKILAASSQLADLFLRKEQLTRDIARLAVRRDGFRGQRQSLNAESHAGREKLQQLQSELHQSQLEASELRHHRATLVERIREDYEVDLSNLDRDYQADATLDREAVDQEIQELRRKIANLGNVNLEALAELQELETRSTTLHAQIADLTQSKATLDEIIRKINQDSQRLFLETFESIRTHFGELFRKLFGGGRADIILENESDVLESGIEIVARPPGKELRSLSLLSGGEKTLTTVALLLAVFRSKPSPFCVLDEVDAALDEANIERYTTLLREFVSQAQFIMITHSKKSMVCADVLYGVTMQESGVSKRVSVRFEDVGEHGEIADTALEHAGSSETQPTQAPAEQEAA